MKGKNLKCPGEGLRSLVYSLPINCFNRLGEEPNRDYLERSIIECCEEQTNEDIEEFYRSMVRNYNEEQKIAAVLFSYGNTRKEIIKNLRGHVIRCPTCTRDYLNAIYSSANLLFKVMNSINGKKQYNLLSILKERDNDMLKLL
jgi:hypothetical protein